MLLAIAMWSVIATQPSTAPIQGNEVELRTIIRGLQVRVAELTRENFDLKKELKTAKATPAPTTQPGTIDVAKQLKEGMSSSDVIDLMGRTSDQSRDDGTSAQMVWNFYSYAYSDPDSYVGTQVSKFTDMSARQPTKKVWTGSVVVNFMHDKATKILVEKNHDKQQQTP